MCCGLYESYSVEAPLPPSLGPKSGLIAVITSLDVGRSLHASAKFTFNVNDVENDLIYHVYQCTINVKDTNRDPLAIDLLKYSQHYNHLLITLFTSTVCSNIQSGS